MSKRETPLTRRYWQEIGGTLIEEFPAGRRGPNQGRRLLDGVVILDSPHLIANHREVEIENRDIVVLQTKASRLGMYLLGQALFSRHLMMPLAEEYGIKVVVY